MLLSIAYYRYIVTPSSEGVNYFSSKYFDTNFNGYATPSHIDTVSISVKGNKFFTCSDPPLFCLTYIQYNLVP